MHAFILFITILIIFLTFYVLKSLKSKQKDSKKPVKMDKLHSFTQSTDVSLSTTPFLMFNTIKIEKTMTITKGEFIKKNFYILKGEIEVLYGNLVIGTIGKEQITYNAFDMLGLEFNITKRAITDLLVAELPEKPDKHLILKTLEKTCFEPALRFCKLHTQVAQLETFKTTNFEEFIFRNFKTSNNKIHSFTVQNEISLDDGIYYVVSGRIAINGVNFEKNSVFGYLGVFFNYYKGFKGLATEETILKYIPYNKLDKKADINEKIFKNMSEQLIYLAATNDWRRIAYGDYIYRKNTCTNYILLVDDIVYGCKECITGDEYISDLIAEKTVDIIKISKITINALLKENPQFYVEITKRMFKNYRPESKIVLIAPATHKCDVFIQRLRMTLGNDAIFLKNTQISEILGKNIFNKIGELVLSEHLFSLRERYKVVVVYLENEYSRMLKIIHPYCDIIFLVGNEMIYNNFERTNVEFVKLYDRRTVFKKKTSRIKTALLYSMLYEEEDKGDSEEEDGALNVDPLNKSIGNGYKRVHHILSPKETNFCNKDFERFARYLTGERFGLVLGGGGAKGYAHIGVIKALEEENIPIDVVGGTSMGAFVGALYARELDYAEVYSQVKRVSKLCSSVLYILMDLSFPFVSVFSGKSLNNCLRGIFKDQKIQDFWLEYYCVTTNLKKLDQSVHFNGSAFKYIRASVGVAGLVPAVFYKGDILCDGAYVNNVPTDVMSSLDVKNIISVRVCRDFDNLLNAYDSFSGVLLFFKSLFLSKSYLTLVDMQYRLSFLTTNKKIELLSSENFVITPDLGSYKASDFHKFDEIVACGYEAAKIKIKEWKASGKIKEFKKHVRRFSI